MSNTQFLPDSYTAPSGNTNYVKFEQGENKFRILSSPIIGWLDWDNNKPLRFTMDKKPSAPIDPSRKVKHFWAMIVWCYKSSSIKVMEVTQASIQATITELSRNEDWGNPTGYDIKIVKKGEGMETEYQVIPTPPKALTKEIKDAFEAKPVILEKLFKGEDPFAVN